MRCLHNDAMKIIMKIVHVVNKVIDSDPDDLELGHQLAMDMHKIILDELHKAYEEGYNSCYTDFEIK
jgi:hypothetical protein